MTAYSTAASTTFSGTISTANSTQLIPVRFTVAPVAYEVRIARIDYNISGQTVSGGSSPSVGMWAFPKIYRYTSGSASSGSTLTPPALRQGSSVASATVRYGSATTVSGTQESFGPAPNLGYLGNTWPDTQTYEFLSDFTVAPGSVFVFDSSPGIQANQTGVNIGGTMKVSIFFEELRLTWPY